MSVLVHFLPAIDHSLLYRVALFYFGFYPIFMAILWVILSVTYYRRRETGPEAPDIDYTPFVSIVIPSFAEKETIARTVEALLALDYPDYEIIRRTAASVYVTRRF